MTATAPKPKHPAPLRCREFMGPRISTGYGAFYFQGKQVTVHRWVMEQFIGRKLATNEYVMHSCDNPPCFLIDHLRIGTPSDNVQDMIAKGRHRYVAHRGEANGGGGKLTTVQAAEIRRRMVKGAPAAHPNSSASLAVEFGIYRTMVTRIARGDAW